MNRRQAKKWRKSGKGLRVGDMRYMGLVNLVNCDLDCKSVLDFMNAKLEEIAIKVGVDGVKEFTFKMEGGSE